MLPVARKITLNPPPEPVLQAAGSWKRQLATAIRSGDVLLRRLALDDYIDTVTSRPDFSCMVTESYLNKMEPGNIDDPLLKQVLPLMTENHASVQRTGLHDPVGDLDALAAPGLIHKYHGRALLITTGACAIHCRYCFRRLYPYAQHSGTEKYINEILGYLKQHPEVDEIILSGGDPLVLDNEKLRTLITQLLKHEQLQTLRIHTRLPVVLPERIDAGLIALFQAAQQQGDLQIVIVIHANHANELQQHEQQVLQQLHAAGITLLNQSVLLRGINDTAATLTQLSKRLFQCKTLPYYLHLLDPVKGAMHFNVNEKQAVTLYRQLERSLPGYLLPKLVRETPGKRAKTAISSF